MPKSQNYSESEFITIQAGLEKIGMDDIAKFEAFATEIRREPWSLYSFICRKLSVDIFPDKAVKKSFRQLYKTPTTSKKRNAATVEKKVSPFEENKPFKRFPAVYSNIDVIKWADDLLKDD